MVGPSFLAVLAVLAVAVVDMVAVTVTVAVMDKLLVQMLTRTFPAPLAAVYSDPATVQMVG